MKRIAVCLFVLLFSAAALSASTWQNFTSMRNTRGAVHVNGDIFVISSGGMYRFNVGDASAVSITTANGLSVNDLSAVAFDENGNIWVGAFNGAIDRYDPEQGTFSHISDIIRTDFTQKDITALISFSDTLLVGTGFGVSVFSLSRNEFNDSYIKFGSFDTQTRVTSIEIDEEYIWVGTVRGIARGIKSDPFLAAPDRWQTYTTAHNLPSVQINDLQRLNGHLYAATAGGLAVFTGDTWENIPQFTNQNVATLAGDGTRLYAAIDNRVYDFAPGNDRVQVGSAFDGPVQGMLHTGDELYVMVSDAGTAYLSGGEWTYVLPDGPMTNILTHLDVDRSGNVWAATAPGGIPRGFSMYAPGAIPGGQWKNFTLADYPELRSDAYYRVYTANDGSAWISNWGAGVIRVDELGNLTNYHNDDGLIGIPGSPHFVVTGRAGEDSDGNIWLTSRQAANGRPLGKWSPDGTWEFFPNSRNQNATLLTDLIVDQYDTKWAISQDPTQFGVFYYNEKFSVGMNTGGWGVVTTQHGLPSGLITAIVEDGRGEIWVGTEAGIAVITNPREPQSAVRDIFTLQDQYINSITVDPLNRKWVGTRDGAYVLSPDGTQLVAAYNMTNTENRILSDDIRSIVIDTGTGIVYFGSERGIASVQTEAAAPVNSFTDLRVSPNPFLIPAAQALKIDGLVRNSSVMVLSLNGRLLRTFASPGGRFAYWDGLDNTGESVASGVYIIVGVAEDGSEVAKTKVTVIRR